MFPEDNWTAIFRGLRIYDRLRAGRVRSRSIVLTAAAFGAITFSLHAYVTWREALYARERVVTTASVLSAAYQRPRPRYTRPPAPFCWVSYQFTPAGGEPQRTLRFDTSYGCGLLAGMNIQIEYVRSRPAWNRPVELTGSLLALIVPMWAATMLLFAWGALQRRAEGRLVGRDGFEAPAIVESVTENPPGCHVLTYRYEAGVKGTQYGQCEVPEDVARRLAPGAQGRVRVDPLHPERSDWL